MPPEERDPKKKKKGVREEEPEDPGNGKNGKRLSRDFKERWRKLGKEEADEEASEGKGPPKRGLGLFKRKLEESKKRETSGFSGMFGPPQKDDKAKEEEPRPEAPEKEPAPPTIPPDKGTGTQPPTEGDSPEKAGVLDTIIAELKEKKEEFIQRRKEELKRDSERPPVDVEPYMSKLAIIKDGMEKKRKEESKPDLFGVGFTPEVMESRLAELEKDEEAMKADLKVVMDRTMKEGSVVKHLEEALAQPIEAIEDEQEDARSRILADIQKMDTKGFEGRIQKILSKVKKGKAFQAENDLVNVKIAMEAQRSREQLKKEREVRLEAALESMDEGEFDLENIVDRHVKAIEIEMDQTRARINRDLRKMDTKGFEHVVDDIKDMMTDDKVFDAEEQLLELKLALKARSLRKDLKKAREASIIERAHDMMPSLVDLEEKVAEAMGAIEELEELEESLPELLAEPEEEPIEALGEVQCGICGTILPEGSYVCPACGTSFEPEGTEELEEGEEYPELTPVEEVPLEGRPMEPVKPPGPPKPPEPPEMTEVICGICGTLVPPGAAKCRACGAALISLPTLEAEEGYPELVPVDEEEPEAYPELVPLEAEEAYPELVPVDEEEPEGYPELAPVEEAEAFPSLMPVPEVLCQVCGELVPADADSCSLCGAPLGEVPVLEPVDIEGDLPELVPVGPGEMVTEELSLDEEGVPVVDMTEEVEVTAEVEEAFAEPEVGDIEVECKICGTMVNVIADECPECGALMVEGVKWTAAPEADMQEVEWRRLCIRGKRFFDEGRVKEALEAYDDALGIRTSYEAYYGKGNALLTLGWSNSALDCYNRALEVTDERPMGWVQRARALETLGRYEEAVTSIDKALAIDPENAEAWHMKGTMLMQMGRVKEAVEALDQWVKVKPTEAALEEVLSITEHAMAEMEPAEGPAVSDELKAIEDQELKALKVRRYRRIAKPRGLTNGLALINGRGLTNGRSLTNGRRSLVNGRRTGLVNGRAITNGKGKGLINGRGLVNGASGLVNGRAVADAHEGEPVIRFGRKKRQRTMAIVSAVVVIALLIMVPAFQYIFLKPTEGIVIDGLFDDWDEVTLYEDPLRDQATSADHPYNRDVDITGYSMYIDNRAISFYLKVPADTMMLRGRDQGVDVVNIFLDVDSSTGTGYHIKGMGADHRLEVFGWDGKVRTSRLFSFNTSEDRSNDDWNGWLAGDSIKAKSQGHQLEVQVPRAELGAIVPQSVLAYIHMSDDERQLDFSDWIISREKGALQVTYEPINERVVDPGTEDNPFLRMELTAQKNMMEIESVSFKRTGQVTAELGIGDVTLWIDKGGASNGDGIFDPDVDSEVMSNTFVGTKLDLELSTPIIVQEGQTLTMFATIDILDTVVMYQTIGLDMDRIDIKVSKGAVTVQKVNPRNSYIGGSAPVIMIDGSFEDWDFVPSNSDVMDPVLPESVDLRDYRSHFGDTTVSFYLSTTDTIMAGMVVPETTKARPVPVNDTNVTPPGPPVGPPDLPELTGGDAALIFIDADQDENTGYRAFGIPVGADFKVKIEGKDGVIISETLYEYDPSGGPDPWNELKGARVPAANDRSRLETQVSRLALGIGPYDRVDAYFVITDWMGIGDFSDHVLEGDRGHLSVEYLDVIPDSIRPGTADEPLFGVRLSATQDIVLRGLTFTRMGNATDMATGALHIYEDDGDQSFTPLDIGDALADGQFDDGVATMELDVPRTMMAGSTLTLFLTADTTLLEEYRTIGVLMDEDGIGSTAGTVTGTFPMMSYMATISTEGDRSNNYGIDYTDDSIDDNWDNTNRNSEGSIWDDWRLERRAIPGGSNVRFVEVCDNGTWMNFYVRLRDDLASNVHIYIDTDGDGNADYDLIYDLANQVVLLYQYSGGAWNLVNLDGTDRYDLDGDELEMGIELSNLGLADNGGDTINYIVTTENNTVPGGPHIDSAPGLFGIQWWSQDYTTIPEFKDLILPIVGIIMMFTYFRRKGSRRGGSNRSKGRKGHGGERSRRVRI
jgi:tetratricopeptide (TPR) repeat protein